MPDFLVCTECAAVTDVTAESLHESMGKTKRGKWRRRTGWLKLMATVVAEWKCSDCLTRVEEEMI